MAQNPITVTVSVNGGSVDRAGFGRPLFVTETATLGTRLNGPYADLESMVSAGYTSTTEPYKWASAVFSQSPAPADVVIGEVAVGDTDLTDTLNQIETATTSGKAWYGLNIENRGDADILLAAAWAESREHIFLAQTDDATLLTGTAGNIGLQLQALAYDRTAIVYHDDDAEYLDGAWMGKGLGADLDAERGAITWNNMKLSGVPFDELTSAQVSNIEAADANYFGRFKGLNFTRQGVMASGRKIDITTTNDLVKARAEEALTALVVNTPTKIDYDQGGLNKVGATILGVLQDLVTAGHFADGGVSTVTGKATPRVKIPNIGEVSDADKTARLARFTAEVVYRGAIESVNLTINTSF